MPGSPRFDFDWPRISRWCLLLTLVMVVWLMAPVAKCSFVAFKDTPVGEVDQNAAPGQADAQRVEEGKTFMGTWGHRTNICYQRTPLLGQEDWKAALLIGFASLTVIALLLGRLESRRKRSFAGRR